MKQEIENLISELKARIADYQDREKSLTRNERQNWVDCVEAVKRSGGYIEGYVLEPQYYSYFLGKLRAAQRG